MEAWQKLVRSSSCLMTMSYIPYGDSPEVFQRTVFTSTAIKQSSRDLWNMYGIGGMSLGLARRLSLCNDRETTMTYQRIVRIVMITIIWRMLMMMKMMMSDDENEEDDDDDDDVMEGMMKEMKMEEMKMMEEEEEEDDDDDDEGNDDGEHYDGDDDEDDDDDKRDDDDGE
ncbi:hypothetical protein GUITHDRAFT_103490 [Guillardia theta CCMP2712]|uniref:Uncharacterized protein n=1 Tax=Guillardia theta (strain CCMP2712) TaxID=905079 RepID=L1JQR9_GUITC|nr:hypothetical protein GUITHDRAFT_103490 [Guillardia theta CCMP2712]EKX50906.1 hypothetical protein GUITHDRAFT_103490 [Guillardia theta CCMP2712]|eukprot:XP_005837886.1 hypothetical protein GUITHDRAFT_103490 [Guillardia theta CCMP2712]